MDDFSWAAVEQRTREWLDARLREGVQSAFERPEGVFDRAGHPRQLSAYHFHLLQRKLKIFRLLDRLPLESFVDVGSGFETYPRLVRERYGVPALYTDFNERAQLPLDGFPSDRLDRAVTANLARLPFPDGAFDVVLCSEVLEHLVRPVEAIAELLRVARKAVVLTSLEALAPGFWWRRWLHYRVDVAVPHVERNFFSLRELRALFGDDCHFENLLDSSTLPVSFTERRATQDATYARITSAPALVDALCAAAAPVEPTRPRTAGILLLKRLGGDALRPSRPADEPALAAWLVARSAAIEQERLGAIARYEFVARTIMRRAPDLARPQIVAETTALTAPDWGRPVSAALLRHLCCPDCRGSLGHAAGGLRCARCRRDFPAVYGVPSLLPRIVPESHTDAVERVCAGSARRRHVVRRIMRRLRRNESPAGRIRNSVWAAVDAASRDRMP